MTVLPPFKTDTIDLATAISAVSQAGKEIMKIYNNGFSTEKKIDGSPITEADLKSNEMIRNVLSKTSHHVLSEEGEDNEERLRRDKLWIIDPLDGTTDFVNRTGEFTVMVSLVENKKPFLGVIGWPIKNTMFVAQKGCGAWKYSDDSWKRVYVSKISKLNECRAVGSRYHISDEERDLLKKLGIKEFTNVGSSLKVGKISEGLADVYLTTTNKIKEWDTCASYCLVSEAGGKMTDMFGNDLSYNNKIVNHQNGILVTNGFVHDKIVNEYRKLKQIF